MNDQNQQCKLTIRFSEGKKRKQTTFTINQEQAQKLLETLKQIYIPMTNNHADTTNNQQL